MNESHCPFGEAVARRKKLRVAHICLLLANVGDRNAPCWPTQAFLLACLGQLISRAQHKTPLKQKKLPPQQAKGRLAGDPGLNGAQVRVWEFYALVFCRTGTAVSQLKRSGLLPSKILNSSWRIAFVTGPTLPSPTVILSTERIGVTSAAVPVKKTSSEMYRISRGRI